MAWPSPPLAAPLPEAVTSDLLTIWAEAEGQTRQRPGGEKLLQAYTKERVLGPDHEAAVQAIRGWASMKAWLSWRRPSRSFWQGAK